jgi:hypothetical protein
MAGWDALRLTITSRGVSIALTFILPRIGADSVSGKRHCGCAYRGAQGDFHFVLPLMKAGTATPVGRRRSVARGNRMVLEGGFSPRPDPVPN